MARIARLVVPGLPHHVTQRGNRRGQTFFETGDYKLYLDLLAHSADRARAGAYSGGERGIRTLGTLARSTVFETAPFDHSGTSPL